MWAQVGDARSTTSRVRSCSHISPPSQSPRSACGPSCSLACPSPFCFTTSANELPAADGSLTHRLGGTGPTGTSAALLRNGDQSASGPSSSARASTALVAEDASMNRPARCAIAILPLDAAAVPSRIRHTDFFLDKPLVRESERRENGRKKPQLNTQPSWGSCSAPGGEVCAKGAEARQL